MPPERLARETTTQARQQKGQTCGDMGSFDQAGRPRARSHALPFFGRAVGFYGLQTCSARETSDPILADPKPAFVQSYHRRAGVGVGRACRATGSMTMFRNTELLKIAASSVQSLNTHITHRPGTLLAASNELTAVAAPQRPRPKRTLRTPAAGGRGARGQRNRLRPPAR